MAIEGRSEKAEGPIRLGIAPLYPLVTDFAIVAFTPESARGTR